MRILIVLVLSMFWFGGCDVPSSYEPASALAERLLADRSSDIVFEQVCSETDFFELEQGTSGRIIIRGNNGVSMARGLNHYLRHYCGKSVSWCGNNLDSLPDPLPSLDKKIRIEAAYPYRYYLNYCTFSYSMAFWDWNQWEQEIDRMALQGVNMPLMAVYSQYAVWQNTLRRLNFTEKEIMDFLPGAGYEAWWLMGNLEGFGGPVSQEFIQRQTELEQKMLSRMRELGMQPVFQAFYGMVPNAFKQKFPDARIMEQGIWQTYQRPAFLDPNDPLFDKVASIYYEEQKKLFGEARFYAGDPFHEGGSSQGIDVTQAAGKILQAIRRNNPEAIWVLQGWGSNPSKELKQGVNPGDILILDLTACERPQWGGITPRTVRPSGHQDHRWIWCALPNYGGKTGLHGRMSSYASGPAYARNHPLGKNICGIGITSEGIGTIPVVYDMVYDMAWTTDSLDIPVWLGEYVKYRYGMADDNCHRAWNILSKTIYECHNEYGGPMESYLCARPADAIPYASTWGSTEVFYDPQQVVNAWKLMFASRQKFLTSDTYQYDLVDLTRQVLSDYAKSLHGKMQEAFGKKDKKGFAEYSHKFLRLIRDENRLLSTRKEFMLGTWLAQAEAAGSTLEEKKRFVANAKRQITTWTEHDSDLHDYANKEWSGLLSDFYLPRWEAYVIYKSDLLYGKKAVKPDYASMEQKWVKTDSKYPVKVNPKGSIEMVENIYMEYLSDIENMYNR